MQLKQKCLYSYVYLEKGIRILKFWYTVIKHGSYFIILCNTKKEMKH